MNFEDLKENYLEVLQKYTVFDGRARRREYWLFFLVNFIIAVAAGIIGAILRIPGLMNIVVGIYFLAILLPSIGVCVRRLHDTGRSGWWILIGLIPLVGLVLLFFMVLDSTPGENEYGPNPKE